MQPSAPRRRTNPFVWLLLVLPYAGLCYPALYVRTTPTLFGFPFFYWYQLAWVILTSALLFLAYGQLKRRD